MTRSTGHAVGNRKIFRKTELYCCNSDATSPEVPRKLNRRRHWTHTEGEVKKFAKNDKNHIVRGAHDLAGEHLGRVVVVVVNKPCSCRTRTRMEMVGSENNARARSRRRRDDHARARGGGGDDDARKGERDYGPAIFMEGWAGRRQTSSGLPRPTGRLFLGQPRGHEWNTCILKYLRVRIFFFRSNYLLNCLCYVLFG